MKLRKFVEHISVMSEMVRIYDFLSRHFFFDRLLPLNQGLFASFRVFSYETGSRGLDSATISRGLRA